MSGTDLEHAALVLVDVQNDFCPGGALAVPDGDRVIPVLNRMIERFEAQGRPVYATRDWHPHDTTHFQAYGGPWPPHCVAGTGGAELHPDLRVPADTTVVSKGQARDDAGYSAFEGTTMDGRDLASDLRARGISRVYVGGLATDYCVRATVLDARRAGFDVTVLSDAVAGIGPDDTRRALDEMREAGAEFAPSGAIAGPVAIPRTR
jgi:nicotinamidase/pyrazinamidase